MPTVGSFPTLRHSIAGVPIKDLAQKFGTPTYVYDEAKIVERINDLKAFDVIRYAQKANSNLAILDCCRKNGVVVDAVSAGEVRRALAVGYQPEASARNLHEIVYTADIFDREALELVVAQNIHPNCGSPDMLDQLGERAPGREITLRINPGFGHGHSQKTNTGGEQSKHGIWHEQLNDCLLKADRHGLTITGLHMHIGSGTDLEHLAQVCGAMEAAAATIGRTITTVSAGGGLPVPYHARQTYVDIAQYFALWDASRKRLEEKFGHKITLEIEPGRYIPAESGYLITEIRAVKQMGANTFYLLDAGFNALARPILYGSYHPMSICPASSSVGRVSNPSSSVGGDAVADTSSYPHHDVVVGGPLCESGDIFTQEEGGFVCKRSLPFAHVGDYLLLECAGAYGFVMASNYNSKPLPAEVLIREQTPHLVRSRQTFEDLVRGEVIPK